MEGLIAFLSFLLTFLGFNTSSSSEVTVDRPAPPSEVMMEDALLNEPNEWGRLPILEYHGIGETEARWTRSTENFKKDLLWLYNNDYILFSIDDYANNHYAIPAGKKPVILTFDDGKNNQFNRLDDGSIDPDSAVGILDWFHAQHPDFGSAAIFYVNATPFGQSDLVDEKIQYLHKTGRQVGYHTLNHTQLNGVEAMEAYQTLKAQKEALLPILPAGMTISMSVAYPHGGVPEGDLNPLAELVKVGLLVGAEPAYPLYHSKADAYRTPRIQAIDEEWLRHFGRQPGATEKTDLPEKFKVFVSDGNPEKITPNVE